MTNKNILELADINIEMICDTCGEKLFDMNEKTGIYQCNTCKREYSKEELISLNQLSIDAAIDDVKRELVSQTKKHFKEMFKKWK